MILFGALCITYAAVPKGAIPWSCVWPGALAATIAMGIVDVAFPLYLSNISTLRIGTSAVFVLIALVWFYILALIVLAGAVINELRFERCGRPREPPRHRHEPLHACPGAPSPIPVSPGPEGRSGGGAGEHES